MDAISQMGMRRWLATGSGAAVVVRERDLELCAVSLRFGRVRLAGEGRVENWRERPAAEWGAEIAAWLRKAGLQHVAVWAVLPPEEAVTRTVALPGVADKDAAAALAFQLEGLHPFGDDEVAADWRRAGDSPSFVVALTRRETLDAYIALFNEAGLKLAGLTVGASALYTALRRAGAPPAEGFLAVLGLEAGETEPLEVYGEGPGRPALANRFELPYERAVGLAAAELRLAEGTEPRDLASLLPPFSGAPEGTDFSAPGRSRGAYRYAAALASAGTHLGAPVNLLPAELRAVTSRARFIPTAVLGAAAVCTAAVLLLQGGWEDRKYLAMVEAEIRKVEPQAKRLEAEEKEIRDLNARVQQLDEFRLRTRRDLEALQALTSLLPPPGWSNGVQMTRDAVQFGGEAEQAEGLLRQLDASPVFEETQLTAPITRAGTVEVFRIRTRRTPNGRLAARPAAQAPAGQGAAPRREDLP
jgi:hypothetical protein